MSEETTQAVATDAETPAVDAQDKTASELERARREAANYRTKLREAEARLKETEPLVTQFQQQQDAQKSEAQKALERTAQLERELAERDSAIQRIQRETAALRLATKAGVDPDLVGLLDLSKIDLDDEKAALETLGKFASAQRAASNASNPGRTGPAGASEDELRALYFGGGRNRPAIFGG